MNGKLKLISKPTTEPVSLNMALEQCRGDAGIEDGWFMDKIKAGRIKAEEYQRRSYLAQTWELSFDEFPKGEIFLPRSPVLNIESVIYFDSENTEHSVDLQDFIVDTDSEPARILPLNSWPSVSLRKINSVKIRYVAGYGEDASSVPETVKDAILLYVSHHWNNRAGETDLPKAFFDLLKPNRLYL